MTKYAVLTAGEDCWADEVAGLRYPIRFDTYDEALDALNEHVADLNEAGMDYNKEEFEIVECDDEGNLP